MGNNTKVGNRTAEALTELKDAGFINLRCYQLEDGAINVGGEKTTDDGKLITDYRRLYTPSKRGNIQTAYKVYRRIFSEYNWFKASNKSICGRSQIPHKGEDFSNNQTWIAIVSLIAMAIIGVVMVATGNAKL